MKEKKRKGKVFSRRIDSYIMWQWSNAVAKVLDSSESQNITTGYISHKVAILLDDIADDDWWSVPATFLWKTLKLLEVIREVVLLKVTS